EQLERERIDYRVVVVGGSIAAPPTTTPPRYFYVSRGVGSDHLLGNLPGHLRAALANLRTDSLKAIIDFSDTADATIGTRPDFYAGMAATDLAAYFGDSTSRRYSLHAVMGVAN